MQTYYEPRDIAGYPRKEGLEKALSRELLWYAVVGTAAGTAMLAGGRGPWGFIAVLCVALGLGFGGWLAEAIFYHHVAVRARNPFSPGIYLIRASLWAVLGGSSGWLGRGLAALLEGKPFAATHWIIATAALSVLTQLPLRLRQRRLAERKLARTRRR